MDWLAGALFLLISLAAAQMLSEAIEHRNRCHREGKRTGSLWRHANAAYAESEARRVANKAAKIDKSTPISAPTRRETTLAGRKKRVVSDSRLSTSEANDWREVEFTYADANDRQSRRRVTVEAVGDAYFEGICHTRQALRTFAIERVRGKMLATATGELVKTRRWASGLRRLPGIRVAYSGQMPSASGIDRVWETAVYFAGFREPKRSELEEMAGRVGWQVRQGFSASLDVMVAGPHAGVAQTSKATALGVDVITEDDFRRRV